MRRIAGVPSVPLLAAVAAIVALAGCATTETTSRAATPSGREAPVATASPPGRPAPGDESDERRRARIRVELAASYYQQGNHAVAVAEAGQAASIDPTYAPAFGLLGLIHMTLGDAARADASFRQALGLTPDDADLNNNYGWFLCQSGRADEAMPRFMAATRDPLYATPAKPWHNAGICALRSGDEKTAESHFLRAFQLDPSNPVATFQLAELYLRRNDAERARFYAQRLMRAWEPTAETLWLAYRVERQAGDRDAAESYATQLRRRFPASREAAGLEMPR